jgi:uncharacterized membrane protein
MKISEKTYHISFEIGIILKAVIALLELVVGTLVLFVSPERISQFIYTLGGVELREDPGDLIWRLIAGGLRDFSATSQGVWSFIFLSHGIVKIFLLGGLWKNKMWAYPVSAFFFTLFVFYQLYQLYITPSALLWLITAVDIVVIGLILHEYRRRKANLPLE